MKSARILKKSLNNAKGFSLVELMIVVAIIGMLAAVGIPQYAKFQAKARQSEAKSNLAGLFNAEKSFQSEWNTFTMSLKNAGYGVEGKNLRYLTGFGYQAAAAPNIGPGCASAVNVVGYNGPAEVNQLAALGAATFEESWSNGTPANNGPNTAGATWHNLIAQGAAAWQDATPITGAQAGSNCQQTAFIGISIGDPKNTPVPAQMDPTLGAPTFGDRWSIDEQKNLQNLNVGIN